MYFLFHQGNKHFNIKKKQKNFGILTSYQTVTTIVVKKIFKTEFCYQLVHAQYILLMKQISFSGCETLELGFDIVAI